VLNVTSLVLFRRHLAHKAKLKSTAVARIFEQEAGDRNEADVSLSTQKNKEDNSRSSSGSIGGRNMAKLVLVNSVTGFVHNVLLTAFTFYYLNNKKPTLTMRIT
jgi:hypothetical protein